jgi:heat-inducible transcriptional repressor
MSTKSLLPREQAVLTEIIEYYFAHHQAISARTLSKISHLSLSPTTIRNLMEDLSEAGYLTPYGAARGRVPTQKAFYIYISALRPREEGVPREGTPAEPALPRELDSLGAALERIGPALAERTGYAAVAWLPPREHDPLDWVRFSSVAPDRVAVVLGTRFGDVWSKVLGTAEPLDGDVLEQAQGFLCAQCRGRPIAQVREQIMQGEPRDALGGAPSLGAAFRLLRRAFEWGEAPRHLVWGEDGLFHVKAFHDTDVLLKLHRALRDTDLLPRAQKRGRAIEGGWVAIGSETGLRGLDDVSIVAFPFAWPEQPGLWRGLLAVAGPMHMDYGRVLQSVHGAATALERMLGASGE